MPVGVAGEGGMVASVLVEPGDWVAAGPGARDDRPLGAGRRRARRSPPAINVARADAALAQSELDRAQGARRARLHLQGRYRPQDRDARRRQCARQGRRRRNIGQAQARIGRLDIRAPAAGLVLTRAVEPGQVVGAGSGTLFRIAKGGEMELRARLAEQDLARLRVGVAARGHAGRHATRSFTAQIWQLSPVIDPQTRQGMARIALAYDPALRPGGFAAATITQRRGRGAAAARIGGAERCEGQLRLRRRRRRTRSQRRAVKVGDVSDAGIADRRRA